MYIYIYIYKYILKTTINNCRTLQEIYRVAGKECLFLIAFKKITNYIIFLFFTMKYVDLLSQYKLIYHHLMLHCVSIDRILILIYLILNRY